VESSLAAPASKREKILEGYPVKTILATALILALGIAGISLWGAVHAQRMAVSSSQIFVHGTPVCVIRQAGRIIAAVGMCGSQWGDSRGDDSGDGEDFHGETPSHVQPRLDLPPGHPPVDSIPTFGEGRRIAI
jgi:hypothetical protein